MAAPVDTKLYEILGVSPDATKTKIKSEFRKKAKDCHPDTHPDDPQAKEKFQDLNMAYDILYDDIKRARYDREGMPGSGPVTPPHDVQVRANFRNVLTQLMAQIQDATYESPMDKWAQHYFGVKNKLQSDLNQCENELQKYKVLKERSTFTAKIEGEEDILSQISNLHITRLEGLKTGVQNELQMLEDMNELAKEYAYIKEFNPNPQPQPPSQQDIFQGFRIINNMGPRPASHFGGSFNNGGR